MDPTPRVITVGHAIVDVLAPSPEDLVGALGLDKGTMTLVDDRRGEEIYAALGPATEASGGSAANTAAGLASFGTPVEFAGKVADDGLGKVFTHDIRAAGVRFEVAAGPAPAGVTGRCLILVTPDAERTMCTNLGIGATLAPGDIDAATVAAAEVVYLEGYLCGDGPTAAAVDWTVESARAGGTRVAMSASDPAWVDFQRPALIALLDRVDILFANELEALGLAGTGDLSQALTALSARCETVVVTLGARGCIVVDGTGRHEVPAVAVDRVVDTTGAGDSYAAGFLHGVVGGLGPETSARLGALAAAEVISHIGARPLTSLSAQAREAGLL